jgi:hypothetical protein
MIMAPQNRWQLWIAVSSLICYLFLIVYALWGYRFPIITFQTLVAFRAVFALIGFFLETVIVIKSLQLLTFVLLIVFMLTMVNKETTAKVSILLTVIVR